MAKRKCRQIFALLSELLDGELPARDCRALERHLKDCKPCVAYLRTLRLTVEACREYGAGAIPKPPSKARAALAELMKSLEERRPKQRARRSGPH